MDTKACCSIFGSLQVARPVMSFVFRMMK